MLRVTQDLMLPTAITGSYPRPLWYDANLSGRSSPRSATRCSASSISTRWPR